MDKNYKKVKFSEKFRYEWISGVAIDEGISKELAEASYLHGEYKDSFKELEDRVSGQIGFVYHDSGRDYFEKEDDNWLIPENCFEFIC